MEIYKKVFEKFKSTEYYDFSKIEEEPKEDDPTDLFKLTEYVPKHGKFTEKKIHYGEERFVKELTNPLYAHLHNRLTIVVDKKEDKITLKYFIYRRVKEIGKKYYKTHTSCSYVSYNYKKNLLYRGNIINYHKKRKFTKRVRVEDFGYDFINDVISNLGRTIKEINGGELILVNEAAGWESFTTFIDNLPNVKYCEKSTGTKFLIKTIHKTSFLNRGFKLSDNWWVFSCEYPQPKTKIIRKNKNKYLDAIMEVNNLKGDKVKRVLHKLKNGFYPSNYHWAVNTFGIDYILQKPDELIIKLFECKEHIDSFGFNDLRSKKERDNIFEIVQLVIDSEISPHTFRDHFVFYNKIRKHEDIRWNSKTYDEFREEHLEWTEKYDFYTKGTYKRIYSDEFIRYIEEPINGGYYPRVLTSSDEYNRESFLQSNCVKGYIQRASSLIVSLRKNEYDGYERATIEYRVTKKEDKIKLTRVQTLGRFNNRLDSTWDESINNLDDKIDNSIELNLFDLPKINCKIANKEVIINSEFREPISTSDIFEPIHMGKPLTWTENINNILDTNGIIFINDFDF